VSCAVVVCCWGPPGGGRGGTGGGTGVVGCGMASTDYGTAAGCGRGGTKRSRKALGGAI
jgi:hypothetical protein